LPRTTLRDVHGCTWRGDTASMTKQRLPPWPRDHHPLHHHPTRHHGDNGRVLGHDWTVPCLAVSDSSGSFLPPSMPQVTRANTRRLRDGYRTSFTASLSAPATLGPSRAPSASSSTADRFSSPSTPHTLSSPSTRSTSICNGRAMHTTIWACQSMSTTMLSTRDSGSLRCASIPTNSVQMSIETLRTHTTYT
jgi:hypothetical protein